MKKIISFFALVFLLCISLNSFAQVITIPAANTNSGSVRMPYGCWFGFERTANLYTAAEVTQFGTIYKVSFFLNSFSSPAATTPVIIKMLMTASTTLSSATYATVSSGATTVFTGNITSAQLVAGTWITVSLDAPFSYTANNLLVLVEANFGGGGGEGSSGKLFRISSPGATRFESWAADTSPPTGTGSTSSSRNNIQLDFTAPANCSVTIANQNPTGTLFPGICTPQTLTPQAKITNLGTMDQTSMSVRYEVPSEGYDQTVSGLTLLAGNNTTVNFPSSLTASGGSPGTKNVTITVDATCDGGSVNYVLNTSYDVSAANYHFGGPTGGYFFANSTSGASCAPNQPTFDWKDTTGSKNLILNGVNVTSPNINTGGVDDGFFGLGNVLPSGDKFKFSGVDYDSFYVGTNGMIAFTRAFNTNSQLNTFQPLAIPSVTAPRAAIFPFWKDFNYGDTDVPNNRLCYKYSAGLLIITYSKAPLFNAGATDYTSFQIILETGPSPATDGVWTVQYNDALSGADFLSKYFGSTLDSHTVGQQNQAGTVATQYRRVNGLKVAVVAGPLFSSPVAVSFGPNSGALPVELASFTSTINRRDVTLNWTTAKETNNSGFDIERSVNGEWTKVGNVAGSGTVTTSTNYTFTDRNLASGKYNYRLKQIDFNGNFEYFNLSSEVNVGIPSKYDLAQNYPNPFNPSTTINYDLPFDGKVSIKLFDMSGREVSTLVNDIKTAGYYSVNFNASNLSSGVYFYRISAEGNGNNFVSTKKMMLVK